MAARSCPPRGGQHTQPGHRHDAWLAAVVALLSVLAGLASQPDSALAHAVLLRGVPPANQTLSRAPEEVRLLFSEPIDIVFSGIHVSNAAGQPVDRSDTHVDSSDDHQLVVSLESALPDGVYTVSWRSLSTIDVHPDEGQYALFVGVPVATGRLQPSAALAPVGTTPATTLGRWWFYLAASLFGGVLAAWKLVLGPIVGDAHAGAVRRQVYRLTVLGGVLLVVGTLFTGVAQAAAAAGVPLLSSIGQPLSDLLLRGRFAAIWWPRIGLELASLVLVGFGGVEGLAAECALATLPGVLLTSSLTSHGAALIGLAGVGIATDWLHIIGATGWIGGLIALLVCLPAVRTEHGLVLRLLGRFSRFALLASAVVLLSGIVQAVFEVGSWSALGETGYGELVLIKAGLLAGMLTLAAFNTWQARLDATSGQRLSVRRSVWAELALGVIVLGVAAVLTGTPPVSS